jgi:hypothetical protein
MRPAGSTGLLNLTVPFATLAGMSAGPGKLSRLGVVTAGQARQLAVLAAQQRATRWRVVVTTPAGQAIAVSHIPRSWNSGRGRYRDSPQDGMAGQSGQIGLVGKVTLTIPAGAPGSPGRRATRPEPDDQGPPPGSPLSRTLALAWSAAMRAAERAAERGRADARAGGCAHELASTAYRPPPRVAELVTARDGTCRFGTCRRPAEQCDLDHTVPFDRGGLTCTCNLGSHCRSHHQLKQHPRWTLTQPAPGVFRWTTPAGRTYIVRPDPHDI